MVDPRVKTARSVVARSLHVPRCAGSRHSMRSTGALMAPRRRLVSAVRRSPSHGSGPSSRSSFCTCRHAQ